MTAIRDCAAVCSSLIVERLRRVNPDVTREQVEHARLNLLAPPEEENPDIALSERMGAEWAKRQAGELDAAVLP